MNTLNMPQCRDSVVHKICIRKPDGYLFILNNIVSEKWSLEKSLTSGLISDVPHIEDLTRVVIAYENL